MLDPPLPNYYLLGGGHAPGAAAPSPRLPSLVSLRDAHARLMAQRDEVDTAFKRIDAAAAAVPVPRPGRRVPARVLNTSGHVGSVFMCRVQYP